LGAARSDPAFPGVTSNFGGLHTAYDCRRLVSTAARLLVNHTKKMMPSHQAGQEPE
jgi:hypothetical protein